MKGSPAIEARLLNGLELKHQSRFGLDCLNDHSIAEDLSRLLVERTSRGVEAFNCTRSLPDERQPLWGSSCSLHDYASSVVFGIHPSLPLTAMEQPASF